MGAIAYSILPDTRHAFRKRNRGQTVTSVERRITYRRDLIELNVRDSCETVEGVIFDFRDAVRDGQGRHFGTIHIQVSTSYMNSVAIAAERGGVVCAKTDVTPCCQIGDIDRLHRPTAGERILSHGGEGWGHGQ